MKRRNVLKQLGAVSIAGVAATGTASASGSIEMGLERTLDVSDKAGEYVMADLLTEEEIANVPDHVPVHETTVVIAPEAQSIEPYSDCCCCDGSTPMCDGVCCECPML